jgi:hypothetical protein
VEVAHQPVDGLFELFLTPEQHIGDDCPEERLDGDTREEKRRDRGPVTVGRDQVDGEGGDQPAGEGGRLELEAKREGKRDCDDSNGADGCPRGYPDNRGIGHGIAEKALHHRPGQRERQPDYRPQCDPGQADRHHDGLARPRDVERKQGSELDLDRNEGRLLAGATRPDLDGCGDDDRVE